MIQAVIFDMDGLMFDSEGVWLNSWEPAFARHGLKLTPDLLSHVPGMGYDKLRELVLNVYNGNPEAVAALDDHYKIAYKHFSAYGAPKKTGLDELLGLLLERKIPCAVASSSPQKIVEANLTHANVKGCFRTIVTGDENIASKPSPDIFLEASDRLHVKPSHTLVLEDSGNGIKAAAEGGFISILIPDLLPPDKNIASLATFQCRTLLEVHDLLMNDLLAG